MPPTSEPVAPIYIGPGNAQHVTGWSWRYVRDFAQRHGVEVLKPDGKPCVRASELQAAIERAVERHLCRSSEPVDELAAMRARHGLAKVKP